MRRDAFLHLARGLVGEGDGEDLARPGLAGGDEMGKPRSQRRGLAGARAGEDEHRSFGRQHRFALRRIQALQIGGIGRQCRRFRHLAEVGGGERNGNRAARFDEFGKGSDGCARYPRYPQASYRIFRFRDSEEMCMVSR